MTFEEMETLLLSLGYARFNKGKTSGSRVVFEHNSAMSIELHKPHGNRKELLMYQISKILKILESEDLI
ncbi:MAG: type II toxin-antitoxin system HicA family toxin [Defluviitaleaceae bacterium]|nr:type II toxin-antitoxin system HicA family toxin [Defluviitaleaceae bacterium]